ncbi:MAG TPA: hemolysin family protein [Bacteroidales bacterium]|nr:hemolysin family protein [Bacteroidales bacterium]
MNDFLVVGLMLLLSAFFSGVEIAFVTANKLKIELDKGKGLLSARIISGFARYPSRFIGAMLLGNNIALVVYGFSISAILLRFLETEFPGIVQSEGLLLLVQTIVSTLVILIVAEFLPKLLFRLNPNGWLNLLAVPLYLLYIVLYPLMFVFISISEFILNKIAGLKTGKEAYQFTAIDLDEYIRDFSPAAGTENDTEQEIQMIQNMMDFHTTKLRECMVPRNEIVAIEDTASINELRELFIESGHSKVLVYNETIDNITGYVHLYDLFCNPASLASVVKPVVIVPEAMTANKVLDLFIGKRRSVAVVVDEFGGTSGMVTTEDLIEEIFGEIDDEFDVEEMVEKKISDTQYLFSARLEIDYLNREYNLDLPKSDEYETLAGLIIHVHQSIPAINDQINIGRFSFKVTGASETRIEQVMLHILE